MFTNETSLHLQDFPIAPVLAFQSDISLNPRQFRGLFRSDALGDRQRPGQRIGSFLLNLSRGTVCSGPVGISGYGDRIRLRPEGDLR